MVRQKPGQRLAYLPEAEAESLAECLVAFANGDGGLIVLGLDEAGRPLTTIWEEDAEGALIEAADYCRPPIPTQWHEIGSPALSLLPEAVWKCREDLPRGPLKKTTLRTWHS